MSLPVWPATVPYEPLRDAWDVKPFRDPLETEMEAGNVRARRRPGDALPLLKWSADLSAAEFAAFRAFVSGSLFGASVRFTMPVSLDGTAFSARTVQMRAGTLGWSASGDKVRVAFDLYVFPVSVVS